MEKTKDVLIFDETNQNRTILRFAFPAAASGLFQQAYGLLHAAILSRALSLSAIAVLGACGAFIAMQSYIANGMTTGFGIYLSRRFGEGDEELYRESFTAAFSLNGALTLLSALLAMAAEPLMSLTHISPQLWADCRVYLQALLWGTGFLGFKNLTVSILQGTGNSKIPGIASAAGVIIQTILLLLFVKAFRLGIAGPPLSTLFCNLLLGAALLAYARKKHPGKIALCPLTHITPKIWKEMLANGFSKSGMMILVGVGGFVMQRAKNALAPSMLAGYSLADTLSNFYLVPLSALAQTASVAAGQNMGRKKYENIRRYNRKILLGHTAASGIILAISLLTGPAALRLLAGPGANTAVIQAGARWLLICIPAFFGLGAAMICRNSLQAMGSYDKLMYLGLLEMGVTIAFALLALPRFGYDALCASIAVKWTALGAAAGYWYWKKLQRLTYHKQSENMNL